MNTTVLVNSGVPAEKTIALENAVSVQWDWHGSHAISCRCSPGFLDLLQRMEISLLVTSAQWKSADIRRSKPAFVGDDA